MIDSYLELIGATTKATQEHEVLIAVQVDARRVAGHEPAATALLEQTERVAQGLEAAEVTVLGALGGGQLARTLRTAFDPYARAELAALEAAEPDRDGLAEANAWPLGAREHWEHYCSDGAVHATFWIGGWPRVDVSPMFMDALLGRSNVVRTVAVTFEPIAPERSTTRCGGRRHPRPRRPRAAPPLRADRDRTAAAGAGGGDATRGRACRGPRRGPAGRVRDGLRARSRRPAPRLLGDPRTGGPSPSRATPDVRSAGRSVHVHAAVVQGLR